MFRTDSGHNVIIYDSICKLRPGMIFFLTLALFSAKRDPKIGLIDGVLVKSEVMETIMIVKV